MFRKLSNGWGLAQQSFRVLSLDNLGRSVDGQL